MVTHGFKALTVLVTILLLPTSFAFMTSPAPLLVVTSPTTTTTRQKISSKTCLHVLEDVSADLQTSINNDDDDEEILFLTPNQIKTLRKESKKRMARKQLPTVFLPPEEDLSPFSQATMSKIISLLEQNELIQVRGIAKSNKRYARQVADQLAMEVGMEIDQQVGMIELNGHAATLYTPFQDESHPDKITLWTSYQPGAWKRKVYAPRDKRGQIIREKKEE